MHRPRRRCPPSRQRHYNRLSHVILEISKSLSELARLGRPGQWVLHQQDLYRASINTQRQRNPGDDVALRGLTCHGALVDDRALIWRGDGPVPNFEDLAFWEGKLKALEEAIKDVKARCVQPAFEPEDLRFLESLEQEKGHFFRVALADRKQWAVGERHAVFNILFDLAKRGRPYHQILLDEDVYHPAIDPRVATRNAEKSVRIQDAVFTGRAQWVGDGDLVIRYELFWDGNGPQPNFADDDYWIAKADDLRAKRREVEHAEKEGIEPVFSADERQALEALEAQENHLFAQFARARKANPAVVQETAEARAAAKERKDAIVRVQDELWALWDRGLAGQWILHQERDVYMPRRDTRPHERKHNNDDDDDDNPDGRTVLHWPERLCYDGDRPLAELDTAYWQAKAAELRKRRDRLDAEADAGRAPTHGFTEGEQMRIRLLEAELAAALSADSDDGEKAEAKAVEAWLRPPPSSLSLSPLLSWQSPSRSPSPRPSPPPAALDPSSRAKKRGSPDVAEGQACHPDPRKKRKRHTKEEEESSEQKQSRPPAKRSKGPAQLSAPPTIAGSRSASRRKAVKPPQKGGGSLTARGLSALPPEHPNDAPKGMDSLARKQRVRQAKTKGFRGKGGTADKKQPRRQAGEPGVKPGPASGRLRRSARIAAQPPKTYR
ncbi:hypothetical protein SPI_00412 [Niveomyces insectorum RCEF 264]|uniref:Uncharacterized protein n=1 Tax=Niveomyces insectorum RCEF 264 TaxID=1081102 RepID=A0A168A420_9HYPO|nr:hypothetical protein SPI_00412 [Niveomyces insectorum RCEF 264]